ncbi:MAG: hypothetical protein R3E10_19115 [Gemmatimonadota bacterium]
MRATPGDTLDLGAASTVQLQELVREIPAALVILLEQGIAADRDGCQTLGALASQQPELLEALRSAPPL